MARIVQLSSQTEPPFLRAEDLTMYLLESVISTKAEIAALRALMADYEITVDEQKFQTSLRDARILELEQIIKNEGASQLGLWANHQLTKLKG